MSRSTRNKPDDAGAMKSSAAEPAAVAWMHTRKARFVYYLMYVVAIIALKEVIHYARALAGDPKVRLAVWAALPAEVVWSAVLIGAVGTLALFIYEDLRAKGELERRSALFERLLARGDERPR